MIATLDKKTIEFFASKENKNTIDTELYNKEQESYIVYSERKFVDFRKGKII